MGGECLYSGRGSSSSISTHSDVGLTADHLSGNLDELDELGELWELDELGELDELKELGELDEFGELDELKELDELEPPAQPLLSQLFHRPLC